MSLGLVMAAIGTGVGVASLLVAAGVALVAGAKWAGRTDARLDALDESLRDLRGGGPPPRAKRPGQRETRP